MLFRKSKPVDATTPSIQGSEATTAIELATATDDAKAKESHVQPGEDDTVYPSGLKLTLLLVSVFISMFLVTLDRQIIAPAIPQITNEFHSVTDIGWYASAFLLTTCAFQLLYGKIYAVYSIKATFLVSIFLFEVGSAVSGAAPNSIAFIIGRAIAGIGGAGVFTGIMVIITYAVPLHRRPLVQGLFGAVFGIASVAGPLLGGAFTSNVTWRWCFYINLPFGAVAMVIVSFILEIPDREETKLPAREKLAQLDFAGTALVVPGIVCLLLALQWAGVTYMWNNGRIIALLVLAGLLLIGFALVQIFLPKTATVPPRVFMQRSIFAGVVTSLFTGAHMMLVVYYLPIWFQAIQGVSAIDSGLRILPLMLSVVVSSILSGWITYRIGYYTPVMIAGVLFTAVGAALLYTLQVDTPKAQWIGYQIPLGWGIGCVVQAPKLAAQTVLPKEDVPMGISLMFFTQLLGGAIFVSVGQNVLTNQLLGRLSSVPGFDAETIENSGATSLTNLPESTKKTVVDAYNESLRQVFLVGLILVCISILGPLLMEWRSVKKSANKQSESEEDGIKKAEEAGCDDTSTEAKDRETEKEMEPAV